VTSQGERFGDRVDALDGDRSATGDDEARRQAQNGNLTGTVGAKQSQQFAFGDPEADVGDDGFARQPPRSANQAT
jgi:hypothetical protein